MSAYEDRDPITRFGARVARWTGREYRIGTVTKESVGQLTIAYDTNALTPMQGAVALGWTIKTFPGFGQPRPGDKVNKPC